MSQETRKYFLIGLLAGLFLVVLGWFFIPRLMPHKFHGTVIQSPNPAPDFTLTDNTGQRVSLSDFQGKVVLLYFGYTFCPDVCPATLTEVAGAMEILGPRAQDTQFIMISVDPERDTPKKLGQYVTHFNPNFMGVTGTPEEIAATATYYGIYYEKHEGTAATGYLVDHTASVMVVDEEGHLKLVFPFGTPAEDIADDIGYILQR